MAHSHRARMHDRQTHQEQHMVRQHLGVEIPLVLRHVHHPLQEIVWLDVVRVIQGLRGAALVDHWDEEVFDEAELFLHLSDWW